MPPYTAKGNLRANAASILVRPRANINGQIKGKAVVLPAVYSTATRKTAMMPDLVGHRAIWWRSAVRVEGLKLVPIPPFQAYDPFNHYWPQGQAARVQRSLPYLFLDVDLKDAAQIVQFTTRFGVLGDAKKSGWSSLSKKMDRVLKKELGPSIKQMSSLQREMWSQVIDTVVSPLLVGAPPNSSYCKPMTLEAFHCAQQHLRLVIEELETIQHKGRS